MEKGRFADIFPSLLRDIIIVGCLTVAFGPVRFKFNFVANNFLGFILEGAAESGAFFKYLVHMLHVTD